MQDPFSKFDNIKNNIDKLNTCSEYLSSIKVDLGKEYKALLITENDSVEQEKKLDEITNILTDAYKNARQMLKALGKSLNKTLLDISVLSEKAEVSKNTQNNKNNHREKSNENCTNELNGEKLNEKASVINGENLSEPEIISERNITVEKQSQIDTNKEVEEKLCEPEIISERNIIAEKQSQIDTNKEIKEISPEIETSEVNVPEEGTIDKASDETSKEKEEEKEEVPKIKIRLVALEKLLDPSFTKNKENFIEKRLNKTIIIIDSDEDDAVIAPKEKKAEKAKPASTKKSHKKLNSKTPEIPKLKRAFVRMKKDRKIEKMASEQKSQTKVSSRATKTRLLDDEDSLDSIFEDKIKQSTSSSSRQDKPSTSKKHHRKSKSYRSNLVIIDSEDETEQSTKRRKSNKENQLSVKEDKSDEENTSDKSENEDDDDFNKKTSSKKSKESESESDWKNSSADEDDDDYTKTKTVKRSRIRTNASSDSEKSSSNSDEKHKTKKKRRRIQPASDSDNEKEKDTRKKLKKIIDTKDLDRDTKKAAREEDERKKRVEERQKLYNKYFEQPESVELEKFVLDFDEKSKEELLCVDSGLTKKLKPHQVNGIKFMWDACFETLKQSENSSGTGCILGHCMGLGKTLQVIALTHTLLTNPKKTNVETVLVITPLSTVTNWAREYHHWIKFCKKKNVEIYDMSKWRDKNTRLYKLKEWHEEGGVCILGYDMFRILVNVKPGTFNKKKKEELLKTLVDPGPDIVICDEGHLLKNEKTSISKAVNQIKTKRRIVLTGTPLQNNLKEYYSMIQFVKPNLLGTYKEYLNRFVNPITNGQYTDSTPRDIQLMKNRSHVLHKLLEGSIQRRDYSVLAPYLPPKHEYVIFILLSEEQRKLYEYYMTTQKQIYLETEKGTGKGASLFRDHQHLRRIWTHPLSLKLQLKQNKKKTFTAQSDSEGSLRDFIDDGGSNESTTDSESDESKKSNSDASAKKNSKAKTRRTRQNPNCNEDSEDDDIEIIDPKSTEWWMSICNEDELDNILLSTKLKVLFDILQECESIGDKILLFSQSLVSLDVIEHFLSLVYKKTHDPENAEGNVNGYSGSWANGRDYFRLDGSNSVESREYMCKEFNNEKNLRARLFLISTRAGCLGINLVAANRVIIFDASWNPSHDTQSIFRIYRFGQKKPCYIYRFIAKGTMEEKIYERQVTKQATAKRVIDEQQISRHYNQNDLLELYKYELVPKEARETPGLPKDRLFADVLSKNEKIIFKYHEHDSLLENEESENLNEDERKAAWAEYEAEKNRPEMLYSAYNRPFMAATQAKQNGPVTSSKIFGFRSDVLLRLLNIKIKRDHPNLGESDAMHMVPVYLQRLYAQMNANNNTLYSELLDLNAALEVPQGYSYFMNSMSNYMMNPLFNTSPDNSIPTQSNHDPSIVHEID